MNQSRMATSSSDKEMITIAEEELSRLCRQLRIMEEDRMAFLDETASKLQKQRKIIQTLKKEKDNISEDISIATCANQKRTDEKLSKNIYKLLEDFQKYDVLVKNEKEQLRELEVQMKKNISVEAISVMMNEDVSKICRLCLEKVFGQVEMIGTLTTEMLKVLPVQLDTSLSRIPVICPPCSKTLQKCFESKMTVLSRNDYLKTFLTGRVKFVNLQEIIPKSTVPSAIKEEEELICRLCLKYYLTEHLAFLNTLQQSFLKDMMDRCFPEIDLGISSDPVGCYDCLEFLQQQFNFMVQCCDSEQLIMNYKTFENIPPNQEINLHDVYDYTSKTRCDFENSIFFIKQENENEGTYEEGEPDDEFFEETGSKACEAENNILIKTESTYKDCGFSPMLGPKLKSGTTYCCPQCPYKTNRRDSLVSHLLVHKTSDTIKIHKCGSCDFQSKWRTSLTAHLLCHKKPTDLTMYKCNDCAYQSKYKKHLRRHIKTHTCRNMFSCQLCNRRSKYRQKIDSHKCKRDRTKQAVKMEPQEVKIEPQDANMKIEPPDVKTEPPEVKIEPPEIEEEPEARVRECAVDEPGFTRLIKPSLNQCWWFKCDYCQYETRKSYHMKEHVVKHLKEGEIKLKECDMCDFKTKYRASLSHHKKHVHAKKDLAV